MAKLSVLDMVQDILNDMDSDEVNSIEDTTEAMQVAAILKSTFFAIMANRNWPHLKQPIQIRPFGDVTLPTHMLLGEDVKELVSFNYNVSKVLERKSFQPLYFVEPDVFLRKVNKYNEEQDNVQEVDDPSGIRITIRNDVAPSFYTTFDDTVMIFNSYDSSVETNMQAGKTQAIAYVTPTWETTDGFVPNMPVEAFVLLVEEAKAKASLKLMKQSDASAEREAGRQGRWLSRKAWRVNGGLTYPNYGRGRGGLRGKNPYFDKNNVTPKG